MMTTGACFRLPRPARSPVSRPRRSGLLLVARPFVDKCASGGKPGGTVDKRRWTFGGQLVHKSRPVVCRKCPDPPGPPRPPRSDNRSHGEGELSGAKRAVYVLTLIGIAVG